MSVQWLVSLDHKQSEHAMVAELKKKRKKIKIKAIIDRQTGDRHIDRQTN